MNQKVAIVGASNKPDRYAYKAFKMLQEYGHTPLPVSPNLTDIEGIPTVKSVNELEGSIETVTMYVGAKISSNLTDELIAFNPKRVIFNPGSENPALAEKLKSAGIEVLEACTLVLLRTQQF